MQLARAWHTTEELGKIKTTPKTGLVEVFGGKYRCARQVRVRVQGMLDSLSFVQSLRVQPVMQVQRHGFDRSKPLLVIRPREII